MNIIRINPLTFDPAVASAINIRQFIILCSKDFSTDVNIINVFSELIK